MTNTIILGRKIRLIRLERGENKTEFGKLFNATGSLVNKWEGGRSHIRLQDKVERLASLIYKDREVEESKIDTLIDLANCAVMQVMWLTKGDHRD